MRTTSNDAAVRLYHVNADSGITTTLLYATLAEALALAAIQPEEMQAALWLQTDNDVASYLDLIDS